MIKARMTMCVQLEGELDSARQEAGGQLHAASLAEAHLQQEMDVQRRHYEDVSSRLQAEQTACSDLHQVRLCSMRGASWRCLTLLMPGVKCGHEQGHDGKQGSQMCSTVYCMMLWVSWAERRAKPSMQKRRQWDGACLLPLTQPCALALVAPAWE